MTSEDLTTKIYSFLELERQNKELTNIPQTIYRDITDHIQSIKNGTSSDPPTVQEMVKVKERELLLTISQTLLRVRLAKAFDNPNDILTNSLTNEEKYILEPLLNASKRNVKLLKAISDGSLNFLNGLNGHNINQYTAVKFLEDSPSTVGIDSRTYGPFKHDDLTILPTNNAKILIQQGKVEKLNMDL